MNEFLSKIGNVVNTNQSRSVILYGNIADLFFDDEKYVPLMNFLTKKFTKNNVNGSRRLIQIQYELNKRINVLNDQDALYIAWGNFKGISQPKEHLEDLFNKSLDNATLALELLRQLTICSRDYLKNHDLLIVVERADLLMPEAQLATMSLADRKRCVIAHDWFSDSDFTEGSDTVIMIAESRSQMHSLVSKMPQITAIEIPFPDFEHRKHYIDYRNQLNSNMFQPTIFAKQTAGLSIYALRQLLQGNNIGPDQINQKVEEYICSSLGDDVVEFKRPKHTLKDVIGFSKIKNFIVNEMIPRFNADDKDIALSGAAIAGPIGGGKTFTMEAMAAELDMPVLVLKNLRSQWFGQTDVIFEKLRRTLLALDKVMIFIDEADTQFGGVGADTHETERRLTGKIQAMMGDSQLRGKVIWLLMTARIERLSADIRRPGRCDLIIPILDPEGQDKKDFCKWLLKSCDIEITDENIIDLDKLTEGYSAASFQALLSLSKAKKCSTVKEIIDLASDILPSDIASERRYQTLQALINCTRKSLLPEGTDREKIREELNNM